MAYFYTLRCTHTVRYKTLDSDMLQCRMVECVTVFKPRIGAYRHLHIFDEPSPTILDCHVHSKYNDDYSAVIDSYGYTWIVDKDTPRGTAIPADLADVACVASNAEHIVWKRGSNINMINRQTTTQRTLLDVGSIDELFIDIQSKYLYQCGHHLPTTVTDFTTLQTAAVVEHWYPVAVAEFS